jgi:hypothetical protein
MATEIIGEPGHDIELDDLMLAIRAQDVLKHHYPYHLWGVNVNSEQGIMAIKAFNISARYGVLLHLRRVYQDPDLKCVMRAGGEILERASMIRGRWNGEELPMIIEGVRPQDQPHGRLII